MFLSSIAFLLLYASLYEVLEICFTLHLLLLSELHWCIVRRLDLYFIFYMQTP